MQDQDFWKTFNHKKHMKDECMGALKIYISFHAYLENTVYALKLHFHQNLRSIK